MPGGTFESFEVVIVPFPFTDRAAAKRRPALIVSGRGFNDSHDHLILAMITSAQGSDWPSDVPLTDWRAARLSVPCRVRFKLFTLVKALIVGRVGFLADDDRESVGGALSKCLASA